MKPSFKDTWSQYWHHVETLCTDLSVCIHQQFSNHKQKNGGKAWESWGQTNTAIALIVISLFCGFLDVVNQQSGFKPQKVAHGSNCTHRLLNIRHNSSIQRRSSLTRMIEDGRMLIPSTLHVVQSQNLDRCTWCKWICYNIQYNCILNCISYWYESS